MFNEAGATITHPCRVVAGKSSQSGINNQYAVAFRKYALVDSILRNRSKEIDAI